MTERDDDDAVERAEREREQAHLERTRAIQPSVLVRDPPTDPRAARVERLVSAIVGREPTRGTEAMARAHAVLCEALAQRPDADIAALERVWLPPSSASD